MAGQQAVNTQAAMNVKANFMGLWWRDLVADGREGFRATSWAGAVFVEGFEAQAEVRRPIAPEDTCHLGRFTSSLRAR